MSTNGKHILTPERLVHVVARRAGRAAIAAISEIQSFHPAEQVAGVAIVLVHLLRKYKVEHVSEVLTVANNIINRAREHAPELKAAGIYIEREV